MSVKLRSNRPHRHARILLGTLIVLVLAHILTELFSDPTFRVTGITGILIAFVISYLVLNRCQHLRWTMVIGGVMGLTVFMIPIVTRMLMCGEGRGVLTLRFLGMAIAPAVLAACIGMGAMVAWRWVWRACFLRLVDESVCPGCAYCIDHLTSDRCPECGEDLSDFIPPVKTSIASTRSTGIVLCVWALSTVASTAAVVGGSVPLSLLMRPSFWQQAHGNTDPSQRQDGVINLIEQLKFSGKAFSPRGLRWIVGPPDLHLTEGDITVYAYFYDEEGYVAYAEFRKDLLVEVGFNVADVNDHSRYKEWSGD